MLAKAALTVQPGFHPTVSLSQLFPRLLLLLMLHPVVSQFPSAGLHPVERHLMSYNVITPLLRHLIQPVMQIHLELELLLTGFAPVMEQVVLVGQPHHKS